MNMPLSKLQEEEMYLKTMETSVNISWIRERLQKGDKTLETHSKRLRCLEREHSILKGKLGAFILGITFIISLFVNGILWAFSHFGGKH